MCFPHPKKQLWRCLRVALYLFLQLWDTIISLHLPIVPIGEIKMSNIYFLTVAFGKDVEMTRIMSDC